VRASDRLARDEGQAARPTLLALHAAVVVDLAHRRLAPRTRKPQDFDEQLSEWWLAVTHVVMVTRMRYSLHD
jgi:hypothetical protein